MTSSTLQGQVALITGAGSGIGRAVALTLAQAGAQVILAARTLKTLDTVVQDITASGGLALAIPTDVGNEAQVENLLTQTSSRFGRLDVLVTSAGGAAFGPLIESRTEDWDSVLTANLKGVYLCSKHALRIMLPQRRGHILNVLSIASNTILPNSTAYTASKFGALGFTKVMAAEVRSQGIKVTAVILGAVNTPLWDKSGGDLDRSKMLLPEDVADALLSVIIQPPTIYTDEIVLMPPLGVL